MLLNGLLDYQQQIQEMQFRLEMIPPMEMEHHLLQLVYGQMHLVFCLKQTL